MKRWTKTLGRKIVMDLKKNVKKELKEVAFDIVDGEKSAFAEALKNTVLDQLHCGFSFASGIVDLAVSATDLMDLNPLPSITASRNLWKAAVECAETSGLIPMAECAEAKNG